MQAFVSVFGHQSLWLYHMWSWKCLLQREPGARVEKEPSDGAAAWPKGKSENGGFREMKWEWESAARAPEGEGQAGGDLSGSLNGGTGSRWGLS